MRDIKSPSVVFLKSTLNTRKSGDKIWWNWGCHDFCTVLCIWNDLMAQSWLCRDVSTSVVVVSHGDVYCFTLICYDSWSAVDSRSFASLCDPVWQLSAQHVFNTQDLGVDQSPVHRGEVCCCVWFRSCESRNIKMTFRLILTHWHLWPIWCFGKTPSRSIYSYQTALLHNLISCSSCFWIFFIWWCHQWQLYILWCNCVSAMLDCTESRTCFMNWQNLFLSKAALSHLRSYSLAGVITSSSDLKRETGVRKRTNGWKLSKGSWRRLRHEWGGGEWHCSLLRRSMGSIFT